MKGIEEDLMVEDIAFFKYAPITSIDVERSFSRYENLHSDKTDAVTNLIKLKTSLYHCVKL